MSGFPGAHDGRVAVVTGAATGLGQAFARRLARDGATVVAVDVDDAAETVAQIGADGGEAVAEVCDVTSPEAVGALRDRVLGRFGRCDILVNNAGLARPIGWSDLDYETWRRIQGLNVDSMFLTCKAFTPAMADHGFGRVVNVSSNTFGLMLPGWVHYIASKGAVIGLTRGLATDLGGAGVTVNCILPGLTRTANLDALFEGTGMYDRIAAQQAIQRPALPDDIEAAVSFLATEDARWITGQSIVVDGGQLRL